MTNESAGAAVTDLSGDGGLVLLPCLWCEATGEDVFLYRPPPGRLWHVYCDNCCAYGPCGSNEGTAIAAWNRRTPTAPSASGRERKEDSAPHQERQLKLTAANALLQRARRIVRWADSGKLADDEWLVECDEDTIVALARGFADGAAEAQAKVREPSKSDAGEVTPDDIAWATAEVAKIDPNARRRPYIEFRLEVERKRALEEAAKVADAVAAVFGRNYDHDVAAGREEMALRSSARFHTAHNIATSIRSLADSAEGK
jgi:hypothetical protein